MKVGKERKKRLKINILKLFIILFVYCLVSN